jgi:SPP1 gp7 family putative phage head morphogenesis protein
VKKLRANTAKPVVLSPVYPNVGVQVWYQTKLDEAINAAAAELVSAVSHAWGKTPPLFHNSHITAMYGDSKPVTAAGVLITSQSRILLMHRTDGEGWAFPAGGVEQDETPETAARRELFEETLHPYNGPFDAVDVRGSFATFTYNEPEPFTPTLNREHDAYAWLTLPEALAYTLHPGVRATLTDAKYANVLAEDAPSPTKALQIALAKWGTQTIKRFDLMSAKIANDFAQRNAQATQASVLVQLKKAGFTVKFAPTRKAVEAYRLVAAENIALIKSIPRKYHEQVEQRVWNAVRTGSDLNKLSEQLRKAHKVTLDRAALIARDQNAKAKAVIERVRQQELGITRGIWQHSAAGKEPRPTHVAMNGKPYELAHGMWDADESEWVHPGQLINCRCTMRPVIEGFQE